MSKTSNAIKDRWNAKVYDDLRIRVPKGRKADIETYAKKHNESINSLVNGFLKNTLEMSDEEWKKSAEE